MSRSAALWAVIFVTVYFWSLGIMASAHEEAPDWLRHLYNREQTKCCGDDDCYAVASIALREVDPSMLAILVNGSVLIHVPRARLVPVSCAQRPHVCVQKSIKQDGQTRQCIWYDDEGVLHLLPSVNCYRCIVVPYCPS